MPIADAELLEKFRWLARSQLSKTQAAALEEMLWTCADLSDAGDLNTLLAAPPKS